MLRYMLDTDTCIKAMQAGATSRLAGRLNRYSNQICISTITLAELRYGAENSRKVPENQTEIETFMGVLQSVLEFDAAAAAEFGRVKVALKRQPIGPMDTLIAAHALSRNLVVVTDNAGEFARVPGLQTESWTS